jgi:4-hydroxyphenylpyruvate dioxygenase-like putative hemolysin
VRIVCIENIHNGDNVKQSPTIRALSQHVLQALDETLRRGEEEGIFRPGVQLLDIPLNYYDDLAARFDFDDEFLSELAYYNVLYDRDANGGELFHVYTEAFDDRFFFEILQRKNGYVGYGAANVAVRLAAMAKSRSGASRQTRL